jgi:hypothetical protein
MKGFGLWRNERSPIVVPMMWRSWLRTSSARSTLFVSQLGNCAAAYCNPATLFFALVRCIIYADVNRRMFSAMAAERAKKRRKLVLRPGYEQLTSIRLQRMPSLLGQDTAGAGQNMETRLAETTSMFFGQSYPMATVGLWKRAR